MSDNSITEKDQDLLTIWNNTEASYPKDQTIIQLFEQQVQKNPNNLAIIFEDQSLSYQELNNHVNRLAHHLITHGIKPESLIGIYIERSLAMYIGLLAILKAGAAYVPLDPEYPKERLQFIIDDTEIDLILTEETLKARLPKFNGELILLDTKLSSFSQNSSNNLNIIVNPNQLAYIIYTSGSTGKPKGVLIEHCSLINLFFSIGKALQITEIDQILATTGITFDISVVELYLPLIYGASIRLSSLNESRNNIRLAKQLSKESITLIQATPSTWQTLLSCDWKPSNNVRLISTGEALNKELAEQLLLTGAPVWNLYGPTETTVWSTMTKVKKGENITIGYPISNTQIYILDNEHNQVPIGSTGELCIAGDGLARGYLNRPELTSKHFVLVPGQQLGLENSNNIRLYKTGDRARWLIDGNVEYLGRLDNQIKLRGIRIELGEIETILRQQSGVQNAAVVLHEDRPGDQRLVAYLVFDTQDLIDLQIFRKSLNDLLPDYMIPNFFVQLDSMPLTFSGKLDRNALPAPTIPHLTNEQEQPTNHSSLENQLINI